jgi:hypothetical protein
METNVQDRRRRRKKKNNMKKIDDDCGGDNIVIIIIIIIVPVRIGALGTVKKGLGQDPQLLPGHPSSIERHITLMSTAHIIPEVLE